MLLERRPDRGVWGGLWSLPQFANDDAARAYITQLPGIRAERATPLGIRRARVHALRPGDAPLLVRCGASREVMEEGSQPLV